MAPVLAAVDWTQILLYGVPAYIAAIGGAVAAILGSRNHKSLKTSNGKTIAEQVESTHKTVAENAAALDGLGGHDKPPESPAVPGV